MCNYCEKKSKLIHNKQFDVESGIFSSIDVQISNNVLIATSNASYKCEEVQEEGLIPTNINTNITKSISINYCPVCGRKLKEAE